MYVKGKGGGYDIRLECSYQVSLGIGFGVTGEKP